MQVTNKILWEDLKVKNQDVYGKGILRYAENWANIMEDLLAQGSSLPDIAESSSNQADTEGITGFMFNASVQILSSCWIHGEQLRQWHNLSVDPVQGKLANEHGSVLNSSILTLNFPPKQK